jgi:hypothetical protein
MLVKFFKIETKLNNLTNLCALSTLSLFLDLYWHDISDLKAFGNKKSIEMAQKGPFYRF